MSIPPLVCSTPPPPDQCEDDKESEDFDLQYNLSQEDDYESNVYGYGNISSLNNFEAISDKDSKLELPTISSHDIETDNESPKHKDYFDTSTQAINKLTKTEDNAIEDLDLKLDQVSIISDKISQTEDDTDLQDSNGSSSQSLERDDEDSIIIKDPQTSIEVKETDNSFQDIPILSHGNILKNNVITEILQNVDEQQILQEQIVESVETVAHDFQNRIEEQSSNKNLLEESNSPSTINHSENAVTEGSDDENDFGDFDDFKFVNSGSKIVTTTIVDTCDNPWGEEGSNKFKANFDDFQSTSVVANLQSSIENEDKENIVNDEDDFGDFDDFKSSTVESKANDGDNSSNEHFIFNFQSTENHNQCVEKSLSSIFEYDITDTETLFQGRLESLLSEPWRQLTDVETRLPYMINWNNSLGQKTLLKALCIDSRNILFGPKWAYNTPKYALNLTAAPLQPQKPVVSSNSIVGEIPNQDKSTEKADTWVDPFTSDGKESCNVENTKNASPPRPTNLEVLEPAKSTKAENIYSTTLSVQPLRQINLPDTHIFTPTDSEIPRSKTIHYDNGNSVLVPQSASTNATEDEYSDFQDFKASADSIESESKTSNVEESGATTIPLKDTSITYQSSILQPIKLEPLTPTLNWPDPGEIKTTFEDFSDFVSNTPWSTENHIETSTTPSGDKNISDMGHINSTTNNINQNSKDIPVSTNEINNDDFATFQSAVPSVQIGQRDVKMSLPNEDIDETKTNYTGDASPSTKLRKEYVNIEVPSSSWDKSNTLSDNISLGQPQINQNITMVTKPPYIPNSMNIETSHSFKSSPTHPTATVAYQVLRPTPATLSSMVQKQTTAQILQPLSLEGYSQINWPNPGSIDLQDLSRFNPVETLPSLKGELNGGHSKNASPAHSQRSKTSDDDWGDFVCSKPKQAPLPKMQPAFVDDDEWTDFVSSPSVQTQNGLNTISLNVHTNLNVQKSTNQSKYKLGSNPTAIDIPSLNYVTPKTNHQRGYNERHFQNL